MFISGETKSLFTIVGINHCLLCCPKKCSVNNWKINSGNTLMFTACSLDILDSLETSFKHLSFGSFSMKKE